jgi:hypothetical protein
LVEEKENERGREGGKLGNGAPDYHWNLNELLLLPRAVNLFYSNSTALISLGIVIIIAIYWTVPVTVEKKSVKI